MLSDLPLPLADRSSLAVDPGADPWFVDMSCNRDNSLGRSSRDRDVGLSRNVTLADATPDPGGNTSCA